MSNNVELVLHVAVSVYIIGGVIAGIYAGNHGGYTTSQSIAFILFWPLWFCRSQVVAFKEVWKREIGRPGLYHDDY